MLAAITSVAGALLGTSSEQKAADKRAAEANALALEQQAIANAHAEQMAADARAHEQAMYDQQLADSQAQAASDYEKQLADARHDAEVAYAREINMMNHANEFTAQQQMKSNLYSTAMYSLQRKHAQEDYQQQRSDQLTDIEMQYVRQREAAEAAGINPLTAMGMGTMTPTVQLQSSSFGASAVGGSAMGSTPVAGRVPALTQMPVIPPASIPMSYGAPVFVAPAASNAAVVGAVSELGQELTSPAAAGKANAEFTKEIAKNDEEKYMPVMAAQPVVAEPFTGAAATLAPPRIGAGNLTYGMPSMAADPLSGFTSGMAETFNRPPERTAPFGTETRPETASTGMSQVANEFLWDSGSRPYDFFGEADEPEAWLLNAPFLGGQMALRALNGGANNVQAGPAREWFPPPPAPAVRNFYPSLSMPISRGADDFEAWPSFDLPY